MMKRRVLFALLLALLCGSRAAAARIDTLSLDSRVLNRPVTVVAVLPDGASEHTPRRCFCCCTATAVTPSRG